MWLIQSGFIQAENILALKLQCCCYNQLLLVSVDKNKCFEKAVSTGCDPTDTDPRFCWTGSAVRGEWGSAHIRANLPRSPGHAHEDRDDVARRVQPDKQAEPRAHWAGVGGARSTKCWEERTTRQWHQVSHGTPRPQESAGSRIIWLESTLVCRVFHILKIFVYRSLPRFPPLIVITALFIPPPHHRYKAWAGCDGNLGPYVQYFNFLHYCGPPEHAAHFILRCVYTPQLRNKTWNTQKTLSIYFPKLLASEISMLWAPHRFIWKHRRKIQISCLVCLFFCPRFFSQKPLNYSNVGCLSAPTSHCKT